MEYKGFEFNKQSSGRGILTAVMCLNRGITDESKITAYIIKAYTVPSKEFSGYKTRSLSYATKGAKRAFRWLRKRDFI